MITLLDSLAESDSCSARRSELEAAVLIERSERSLTAPTAEAATGARAAALEPHARPGAYWARS